jgi:hypothetical protein
LLYENEERWRQRSRAIWIWSGDQNTIFFHNFANFRRNKKYIWEIMDEEGNIHLGQQNIKAEAVNYFKQFFKENIVFSIPEQVKVAEKFSNLITEDEAEGLYAPTSFMELRDVLKYFKIDKSPGPDGWTVEFFDLVRGNLLNVVEESILKGKISSGLNASFLALIPKINKHILSGILYRFPYEIFSIK